MQAYLIAHEENLADQCHDQNIVWATEEIVVAENALLNNREKHANNCLEWLSVSANLEFEG